MKPRIVILSAFTTPFRSGAEACAEEVARCLKDEYDIAIVSARLRGDLPAKGWLPSNVAVYRVGIGHAIDKWLFPFLAPLVVRRLRPELVHAVLESFAGIALIRAKRLYPFARYLLTLQSTNTSLFLRSMHRAADRLTAISRVLVERAKTYGREQVTLIPNGIDRDQILAACGRHGKVRGRMLYVGRLEPMKGVDTLIRAFATLGKDARLHIVGDGSLRGALEKLAKDLGLAERVTFRGYISAPALYDEYAEAEIFCGLSRSEALGNVFLEAQAAGCAVVATTVGGIPEIVEDGKTGILVPPDDIPAAASALQRLIDDPALRQAMAVAGRNHAAVYDWQTIAARYAEVYREMIGS